LSDRPLVLVCDTSQGACSVALAEGAALLGARCTSMSRGHAEVLMPMLAEVMAEAGRPFAALDGLAVTLGPGTFTGVRVGLSAMRGLALALDLPVLGLATLHTMAASADPTALAGRPILVAVDARRDSYYCQAFDAAGVPQGPPQALSLTAAQALHPTGPVAVIGTGGPALAAANGRFSPLDQPAHPLPHGLVAVTAQTAWADWPRDLPLPVYLRPPDATLPDPAKALKRRDDAPHPRGD